MNLGKLATVPALARPDLLADPVRVALESFPRAAEVGVAEIDPGLADTVAFCAAYDIGLDASANCVVVSGSRAGEERTGACLVRADTRADVNRFVRKLLDVRSASFLPMDRAVTESGMEYGGITPVGLPTAWRLLLDSRVAEIPLAVIGSGLRRSKLIAPGEVLAGLPNAEVHDGLAHASPAVSDH